MKRNGLLLIQLMTVFFILSAFSPMSLAQAEDSFSGQSSDQASAQTSKPAGSSNTRMKERRTTLDFDDELIEGSSQKPDMIYLFQQKNFNYKRLIKHRENFLPEMRKTTEDVQRIRSGG